jgi:hypothetical protein
MRVHSNPRHGQGVLTGFSLFVQLNSWIYRKVHHDRFDPSKFIRHNYPIISHKLRSWYSVVKHFEDEGSKVLRNVTNQKTWTWKE